MSLKNFMGVTMKHSWIVILVLFAFLLIGCGSSEETTMEEPQKQGEAQPAKTEQAAPAEEKPMDQALTSFVGEEPEKPAQTLKQTEAAPPPENHLAQYEKQIDDLRTENTGLKQKIVKLEQENRGINARMTETEAKLGAEKLRADKAEELAKNAAGTPKTESVQVAVAAPSGSKMAAPATSTLETYEDGLRSFNAKKYDEAARGFKSIIDAGGTDELTNRATYWLGESYFAKKRYRDALPLFQEALKYKGSEKKADAQFMIAQIYERLGNKAKAKEAYEKVVKDYPMSKNVKRAKERWARL